MLSHDFSYWGDYAVALRLHSSVNDDSSAGWLRSQKVPVKYDNNVTFSWHAKIPKNLTNAASYEVGEAFTGISTATGHYYVQLYDTNDELILPEISGHY